MQQSSWICPIIKEKKSQSIDQKPMAELIKLTDKDIEGTNKNIYILNNVKGTHENSKYRIIKYKNTKWNLFFILFIFIQLLYCCRAILKQTKMEYFRD